MKEKNFEARQTEGKEGQEVACQVMSAAGEIMPNWRLNHFQ
jgi:hypothetical protein